MALGGLYKCHHTSYCHYGRLNISLYPNVFNEIGAAVPLHCHQQPAGRFRSMNLTRAGSVPAAVMKQLHRLDTSVITYAEAGTLKTSLENVVVKIQIFIKAIDVWSTLHQQLLLKQGNLHPMVLLSR